MSKSPIINIFSNLEPSLIKATADASKAAAKIIDAPKSDVPPQTDIVIAPRHPVAAGPFFILASLKSVREPVEGDYLYAYEDAYDDEDEDCERIYPQPGEVLVSDDMGQRYVQRDVILAEGFRPEDGSTVWVRRESEPMLVECIYEDAAVDPEVNSDDEPAPRHREVRLYRVNADGTRGEIVETPEILCRCTPDGRIIGQGGTSSLMVQVKDILTWRDAEGRTAEDVAAAEAHLQEVSRRNLSRAAGAEIDSVADAADIHLVNLEINVTAAGVKPRTDREAAAAVMAAARAAAEAENEAMMNWPAPAPEGLTYDTLPQIVGTAMRQWSDVNDGVLMQQNEFGDEKTLIPATRQWGRLGSHHTRYAEDAVRAIGEFIFEDEFQVDMGRLRYLSSMMGASRETVGGVRQWAEANGDLIREKVSFDDVMQAAVRNRRIARNPMPGYTPQVDLYRVNGVDMLFVEDFHGSYVYSWPSDAVRQLQIEPPAPGM